MARERRLRGALLSALVLVGASVLVASVTAGGPARASAVPFDPCAEPVGQTDSSEHPRLVRASVEDVPVTVVLPRGYSARQGRRYPVLYLLHGAQGDEDSWLEYGGLLADSAGRPEAGQAIVVMPRMGVVTGIVADWVDGYRQDLTLVGQRLVRWTDRRFRTVADRRHRAVAGYSGGGLSATLLAQRFPRTFGHLGVLSGPVDLANPSYQPAAWALFEAEKTCAGDDPTGTGPFGDPWTHADAWAAADPLAHASSLERTRVFLSSGDGRPCDLADAANLVFPTAASEPQIRMQVTAFSRALDDAGVQHVDQRRPCGLHWWTTWRPALDDFWDITQRHW